jgi:hypothetical protein
MRINLYYYIRFFFWLIKMSIENFQFFDDNMYYQEDAPEFFDTLVQKLDSMIEDNFLIVDSERIKILKNHYWEKPNGRWKRKEISHTFSGPESRQASFIVNLRYVEDCPVVLLYHRLQDVWWHDFYYPFNNKYVKQNLLYYLERWMKIATSNQTRNDQYENFNEWVGFLRDPAFNSKMAHIQEASAIRQLRRLSLSTAKDSPEWHWAKEDVLGDPEIMKMISEQADYPFYKTYGFQNLRH